MGEAGEHTPEPTNMTLSLTELRLIRWDQQRPIHGRETSGNEAMARPLGHKPRRAAVSEGTMGGLQHVPHKRQNVTKRENGVDWQGGSQLRGARSNQSTRPAKSKPVRGSQDKPRVRTPWERQGRSQSELDPWRKLEDPTLMGTSKVSSRDGATGSDSNTPTDPEEEEKPTLRQRQCRSDWSQPERSDWDTSNQGRGNDHQSLTHQTTLSQGRDEWKARTRTEGDSRAPFASIASSTCRKAGTPGTS